MNKKVTKEINGSNIKIATRNGYIYIDDQWNGFNGKFRLDDRYNFMVWLDHCLKTDRNIDRCLDTGRRFFTFPMDVYGNYISKDRIPYIKDMLDSIFDNKLYETVLDIKDDTKLLKDVLNHASLQELDDVYSRIKQRKGNFND